ncbi:hypothetical protein ACM73L_31480 [Pseudomonas aeruginosa]|nr:hypothetical protein [Pseudomonas aeruginosa]OWG38430.1 hypothetical protein CAQ69_09790 [Stutzerimonas stutzeri]ELQ8317471.1 hypothetical protein [Pseudomonas aeruginosa]MCR7874156.1 hypothetical protein [Pseudomonas aeruginosa]UTN36169.1 hypothetical protein MMZ75_32685 [Pseudomonas aeruginosa]HBO2935175.1 hypothetical protein [Pseudomonas aeruginosa]
MSTNASSIEQNGNTPCKHCGSQDQSWATNIVSRGEAQNGRLRLSDVACQFVLGCNRCSETLMVLSADRVAGLMNGALDEQGKHTTA